MTRRNENSVLFSLGHLQQMAMASASTTHLSGPRPLRPLGTGPIMTAPAEVPFMPVSVASSTLMMAPRATWPRWLAPVIIGLGTLFVVFLVLALAIALRAPEVKVKSIIPPGKIKAPSLAAVKEKAKEKAPSPAIPDKPAPAVEKTPAAPAPIPPATEAAALPDLTPKKAPPKAHKATKKARRLAALRRRRARAQKARARARRRRARLRKRRKTHRVASSTARYKKKLGDAELDAILNVR